jgi:hypothetical protein
LLGAPAPRGQGLFTGLAHDANNSRAARARWACECCVPEAERRLLAARQAG